MDTSDISVTTLSNTRQHGITFHKTVVFILTAELAYGLIEINASSCHEPALGTGTDHCATRQKRQLVRIKHLPQKWHLGNTQQSHTALSLRNQLSPQRQKFIAAYPGTSLNTCYKNKPETRV